MAWPESLQVALKEWASVCGAMETGRQMLLLRKGGIYESAGEFEVEHRHFLLFPTYLHQAMKMLKPSAQAGFEPRSEEPAHIPLSLAGEITHIIQLQSRAQMDAIDDQHIWTPPLVQMRFDYRPENPLYLLLVRAYRLAAPSVIPNTPAYAGCKSWVPLERPVVTVAASPVLDDAAYQRRGDDILHRVEQGR